MNGTKKLPSALMVIRAWVDPAHGIRARLDRLDEPPDAPRGGLGAFAGDRDEVLARVAEWLDELAQEGTGERPARRDPGA